MQQHVFQLQNGHSVPALIFGTYKTAEEKNEDILLTAMEAGYRGFDTASFYGTESYLGTALQKSGLPREDFFITSKLWKTEMGYEGAMAAAQRSLEALQTDYLDLYLIHWPLPDPDYADWKALDLETWQALEELYDRGVVKAIGVSNFHPHHIENLLAHCRVAPMVDQMEYHPGYSQEAAVAYCQARNILVQAWSPLGKRRVLGDPLVCSLAEKYGVSPAQICLKFALQRGVIPLPKASSLERMRQNRDLFSFELEEEDLHRLTCMPPVGWSGEHPDRPRVPLS